MGKIQSLCVASGPKQQSRSIKNRRSVASEKSAFSYWTEMVWGSMDVTRLEKENECELCVSCHSAARFNNENWIHRFRLFFLSICLDAWPHFRFAQYFSFLSLLFCSSSVFFCFLFVESISLTHPYTHTRTLYSYTRDFEHFFEIN